VPAAEPFRCSAESTDRDEPLTGTASRYRFWLMLEQPGPWGHDALVQSDLPTDVGERLRVRGRDLGVRVLLIKQREARTDPRVCFLAYTGTRERRLARIEVEDPAELLDLDLEAMVAARFQEVGEPVAEPLFLVCTHGKHDACCALHGTPLARALEELRGSVWECTHIGGDRFAGNLVCFPHGMYFGRVGPSEAVRVARAYSAGRLELDHYRGRSAFSPPVQAAEEFVRRRNDLDGVDDLVLRDHRTLRGGRHHVVFRTATGSEHAVEVAVAAGSPRRLPCKATHDHRPRTFESSPAE
jgi:hypothetical protein